MWIAKIHLGVRSRPRPRRREASWTQRTSWHHEHNEHHDISIHMTPYAEKCIQSTEGPWAHEGGAPTLPQTSYMTVHCRSFWSSEWWPSTATYEPPPRDLAPWIRNHLWGTFDQTSYERIHCKARQHMSIKKSYADEEYPDNTF
jgi:hypothetical protein